MPTKISFLLPALAVFSFALAADAGDVKLKKSNASFSTSALKGGVTIAGTCNPLSVKSADGKLILSTKLASLDTKISARNSAAQKDLNPSGSDKGKEISFSVDRASLKTPTPDKPVTGGKGRGIFKLNNQGVEYPFTYDAKVGKDGIDVTGKMTFDYTRHGLEEICLALVCVKHEVAVDVSFTLDEK